VPGDLLPDSISTALLKGYQLVGPLFYHPLVHWLGGRLQIHQELAADALAAPFAGGRTLYLQALARMALRQADRPSGWPARTFLSGPGTLMRRIRMLREMQNVSVSLSPRWARLIVAGILTTVVVGVSPLRSPAGEPAEGGPPWRQAALPKRRAEEDAQRRAGLGFRITPHACTPLERKSNADFRIRIRKSNRKPDPGG
jgi:hypothetical protein